jgi:hypothetical protein
VRAFVVFFGVCLGLATSSAISHEVRPAYLELIENRTKDSNIEFRANFRQPQVEGRFLGLVVETNCDFEISGSRLTEGALTDSAIITCDEFGLASIEIAGLDRTLIDTLVSISWLDGSRTERLITASEGRLDLASVAPAIPIYFSIGLTHLLLGYDHILFVLMLLYLVRTRVMIVWVVTGFTVAHSITLALSAYELLSLSQSSVEAVIAASIVLLAYENLQTKPGLSHRFPVIISFGFGLLHGLGFAGALKEIGLPDQSQIAALFLFNLGIEVGQLAIVVVVLGLLGLVRYKIARRIQTVPVYFVGGTASYWFLERIWLILLPAL